MLYFIPAWYKNNTWMEDEQVWYRRREKSEFDETIKQITLFHRNVDVPYQILQLAYAPNFRHFLHRQSMYRAPYWSCFDAIAQIRRSKTAVLSYHDIKWPEGTEFIYSPFRIVAYLYNQKFAQIEFGEDGNPISIDMFADDVICRRNYYDDRGFVSSTVIFENGQESYTDYLMENGIWKMRQWAVDGHVQINPQCPYYDVYRLKKRKGVSSQYEEVCFARDTYKSMEDVISEVFSSYLLDTSANDSFFVAMHPQHMKIVEKRLRHKTIVASFFESRYPFDRLNEVADFLFASEHIITDSKQVGRQIQMQFPKARLNIEDIPPYDARIDFGVSTQLNVQNILIPVDGLSDDDFEQIIMPVTRYMLKNELVMAHIFSRDASYGHKERIRDKLLDIIRNAGFDERLVLGDDAEAMAYHNAGLEKNHDSENDLDVDEETQKVERRFFIEIFVEERDISKCINVQRLILDMRKSVDVYTAITAISKGVPRVFRHKDQFVEDRKNGYHIDSYDQIEEALGYYLDGLEHWNEALIGCYEASKDYTTDKLLNKWRKVLGISE